MLIHAFRLPPCVKHYAASGLPLENQPSNADQVLVGKTTGRSIRTGFVEALPCAVPMPTRAMPGILEALVLQARSCAAPRCTWSFIPVGILESIDFPAPLLRQTHLRAADTAN